MGKFLNRPKSGVNQKDQKKKKGGKEMSEI